MTVGLRTPTNGLAAPQLVRSAAPPTVVVIGMHAAGKTALGHAAAELLGFEFVELDTLIAEANRSQKSTSHLTSEEFRTWTPQEIALTALAQRITQARTAQVIACNTAVVESAHCIDLLRAHWPVILLDRHIDDIVEDLASRVPAREQKAFGEALRSSFAQQLPIYEECADYNFLISRGDYDLAALARSFARLIRRVADGGAGVYLGPETFLLPLTLGDYKEADPRRLSRLCAGVDAVEFRADLLRSHDPVDVAEQLAVVRRITSGTPILFSVRTRSQGGHFAGSEAEYLTLLRLGLRLGVEILDVDCTLSRAAAAQLLDRQGPCLLMGSYHDMQNMPTAEELRPLLRACSLGGGAAAVRLVVRGASREAARLVQAVAAEEVGPGVAFVGVCLGAEGQEGLSLVLNQVLTPVKHPELAPAYPGLLSVKEIMACRRILKLEGSRITSQQFPAFGPWHDQHLRWLPGAIGDGFATLRLPHIARAEPAEGQDEVEWRLSLPSVGGAALLGPVQALLPPLLPGISEMAGTSCVVDCIVRRPDGSLFGENAGGLALRRLLKELPADAVALVLGEGSLCCTAIAALKSLGCAKVFHADTGRGAAAGAAAGPPPESSATARDISFVLRADGSKAERLGIDVSHNGGAALLVEGVGEGGAIASWNANHPGLQLRPGDSIVEVNGITGHVSQLVEQLSLHEVLEMRVAPAVSRRPAGDPIEDMVALSKLERLDVVVFAELPPPPVSLQGGQWLTPMMELLRPLVLDLCFPPRRLRIERKEQGPDVMERARLSGCRVIDAEAFLLARASEWVRAWTGKDAVILPRKS